MRFNNSLDGWLPVDKLGQILALIFVLGIAICMIVGIIGLIKQVKRYFDSHLQLEKDWCDRQEQLHNQEDENWRQVPTALEKRIKELEKQLRSNQVTIGALKEELARKNQFLSQTKLKDAYDIWAEQDKKEEMKNA